MRRSDIISRKSFNSFAVGSSPKSNRYDVLLNPGTPGIKKAFYQILDIISTIIKITFTRLRLHRLLF